jgi:F-type H+-transporting ATPase subunit epsilon
MAELQISIVAADHEVWAGAARQIVARTLEGEIGILPGHEPILALLAPGEVRVSATDGSTIRIRADDGFLSVENDRITIVSRVADRA